MNDSNENILTAATAKFRINSSHQGFTDRQKNLFDQLDIVESERNTKHALPNNGKFDEVSDSMESIDSDSNLRINCVRNKIETKQFRGKESIFKKPQSRLQRGRSSRRIPDYRVNPHKWTKYSLDDVRSEDMSERSNTATAMSFLKEMQLRKCQDQTKFNSVQLSEKVVFNKAYKTENERDVEQAACTKIFQNSKVIMPEYIIGQKVKREQIRSRKNGGDSVPKQIKLNHLHENDEDNEN